MTKLPVPDQAAVQQSQRVSQLLRSQIEQADGHLSFSQFMHTCLYTPEDGYYQSTRPKFGSQGDFITAPEISPLFGDCIAHMCADALKQIPAACLFEFGAGSGHLAADILGTLATQYDLYPDYKILELSSALQQRQRETLQRRCPDCYDQVAWLSALPETPFTAIILANEVLDAIPFDRFIIKNQQIHELHVVEHEQQFAWQMYPANIDLNEQIKDLVPHLPDDYVSEYAPQSRAWLHSLADLLEQGLMLLIDYGTEQADYYHPQRNQGSLRCFYKHHVHGDPFLYTGLQDITTHVNFTDIAETALKADLQVAGYTTQAYFLLDNGLSQQLEQYASQLKHSEYLAYAQQAKQLILPDNMGERFKVMLLQRNMDDYFAPGFKQDLRIKL